MQVAGAVFFPAAGFRDGYFGATYVNTVDLGDYWSSAPNGNSGAYRLYFFSGGVNPAYDYDRSSAYAVRLATEY